MSLADVIRGGIATARRITLSLHVDVTHKVWKGQTYEGVPDFAIVVRKALVERKQKLVKNMTTGQMEMSEHYLAFIEPIAPTTANAGQTRTNPVDVNDVFVLPDGSTGPIITVDGFFDGGTGVPYYTQVYLG